MSDGIKMFVEYNIYIYMLNICLCFINAVDVRNLKNDSFLSFDAKINYINISFQLQNDQDNDEGSDDQSFVAVSIKSEYSSLDDSNSQLENVIATPLQASPIPESLHILPCSSAVGSTSTFSQVQNSADSSSKQQKTTRTSNSAVKRKKVGDETNSSTSKNQLLDTALASLCRSKEVEEDGFFGFGRFVASDLKNIDRKNSLQAAIAKKIISDTILLATTDSLTLDSRITNTRSNEEGNYNN